MNILDPFGFFRCLNIDPGITFSEESVDIFTGTLVRDVDAWLRDCELGSNATRS
jgi:hypothetical protein